MSAALICFTHRRSWSCSRSIMPVCSSELDAIAAGLAALAVSLVGILRGTLGRAHFGGHGAEPDGAGRGQRLRAGLVHLGRDLVHDVLGPGLDVLRVAALDEQHEAVSAEAAGEVAGLQLLAQQAREVAEEILGHQDTELLVQRLVLVGLDVDDAAHAALRRFGEPHRGASR